MKGRKKIAVVVDNRTNWTKAKSICDAIVAHKKLKLELIIASSFEEEHREDNSLSDCYGKVKKIPTYRKSMGATSADIVRDLSLMWMEKKPRVVVALTDRFETLAVAQASILNNIRVAHIQGGELSGTIDEGIRHAVTKLSHYHFVANGDARRRVIALGEDRKWVFNVGCPSIDLLMMSPIKEPEDVSWPYILCVFHPVVTELPYIKLHASSVFQALKEFEDWTPVIVSSNRDEGHEYIREAARIFGLEENIIETVTPEDFYNLMRFADLMIGNSSAGIREASYYGLPVVDCGSRQNHRMAPKNVLRVADLTSPHGLIGAMEAQLEYGRYETSGLYGKGDSGRKIAQILARNAEPPLQKVHKL